MGFDKNAVNDAIHAALNQPALTALVGDRIYHRTVPPGRTAEYPMVVYQSWGEPSHEYALGEARVATGMTYRIVCWHDQNPREANDIALLIDDLLTAGVTPSGMETVVCRSVQVIDVEAELPDGRLYQQAGGIYEIGVA